MRQNVVGKVKVGVACEVRSSVYFGGAHCERSVQLVEDILKKIT
jgi:hypothetical protein